MGCLYWDEKILFKEGGIRESAFFYVFLILPKRVRQRSLSGILLAFDDLGESIEKRNLGQWYP